MFPHQQSTSSDEEKFIGVDAVHGVRQNPDNRVSLALPNLNLDEDEIFEAATDYLKWTYKDITLKNLPAFDHSISFGITVDDENSNIREEIKKIFHFVNSNEPPLFDSYGTLGGTNAAGFEDLSNVVDQISSNLQIIRHDNACLALDHYVDESFYNILKRSRAEIRRRYLGTPNKITGHNPKGLKDEISNVKAYHALVDFIFQSLAWWLMHVAKRKSWRAPIIAVLARWSVKLKLIALEPTRWATMSLIKGEDTMRRIFHDQKSQDRIMIKFPPSTIGQGEKEVNFPDDRDLDYSYYSWKLHMRENLFNLVRRVLGNLVAEKSHSTRSPAFEVRTLMYRGVLDNTLRHLTVQQDRTIEICSENIDLRRSYCALHLLLFNAQRIPVAMAPSEGVKFHWYIKRTKVSDPNIKSVVTTQLDDIVSMLVPLSLVGSSRLVNLLDNPSFQEYFDDGRPSAMPDQFSLDDCLRIEFSLSSRQGRINTLGRFGTTMIPASRSPLITSIEDIDNEIEECDISDRDLYEVTLKKNAIKVLRDYQAKTGEFKTWAVTEDSVRVRTPTYSFIVLTVGIGIIAGALTVPFLVKEGIPGVDPFQFVTFGWLLAGAFLVLAKSRYVENWPWHDFLRGQIVCRSVSELAVASRVKEQAVLLYLLHYEFRNPLVYGGPYHGIFRRRAKGGARGFDINVPTSHAAVLAAGFIALEFLPIDSGEYTDVGEHTDARDGEWKVNIELHDTRKDAPGTPLVFSQYEGLEGGDDEQKPGFRKICLKLDDKALGDRSGREILGLPTADYDFI